jgi:hypothetical protein
VFSVDTSGTLIRLVRFQLTKYYTGSEYSLTFFNEARLKALAIRLGHDRVSHTRAKVANIIGERMRTLEHVPAQAPDRDRIRVFDINEEYIAICVRGKHTRISSTYLLLTL